jgi:SAM-dependent methyltransferase
MMARKPRYDAESLRKRGYGRALQLPRRLRLKPEDLQGKRILEVGCGFGEHTAAVAEIYGAEAVGIDPWPRFLDGPYADRSNFLTADILDPGITRLGQFDVIASYDVLEHVVEPHIAIEHIAKMLALGGRAFLKFNLHRGASASHVVHLIDFPWCHLILTAEQIEDLVWARHGYRRGPSWVNRATYAHYLEWFTVNGLKAEAVWYDRFPMSEDFHQNHAKELSGVPRYELERNFMLACLIKQ